MNLADRTTWPTLAEGARRTGGVIVEAGEVAARAARGSGAAPLEERVARIFAPDVGPRIGLTVAGRHIPLGSLVAGEQIVWEGTLPRRGRVVLSGAGRPVFVRSGTGRGRALAGLVMGGARGLAAIDRADAGPEAAANDASCIDERGPAHRTSGVSSDAAPVAVVETRSCAPPSPTPPTPPTASANPSEGPGVPAETILRMLRQRVRPVARRCFRRDRAGRLDYAVRAELIVRLEDRELTEARVDGQITDTLRACILSAAHDLDVPRFSGAVIVRYPLLTARVPSPPVIELVPDVAREVDSVIGVVETPRRAPVRNLNVTNSVE